MTESTRGPRLEELKTKCDHAEAYIQIGWHIFPCWWVEAGACACGDPECKSKGKHPIPAAAPHGCYDASIDIRKIRNWWRRYPEANIGLHCGPSGVLAMDLDIYKETYLQPEVEKLITPEDEDTVTNLTPSPGQHLIFGADIQYGNHNKLLPPGIDIRGRGGYIMLPPSTHLMGVYQWEADHSPFEIKPAPLPLKLRALLDAMEERACSTETVKITPNLPKPNLRGLPGWLKEKINDGKAADRSDHDYGVARELIRYGWTDEQIAAVFQHYAIGTEGKYAEAGDSYLGRTIGAARASVTPEDMHKKKERAIDRLNAPNAGPIIPTETTETTAETMETTEPAPERQLPTYFVNKGRIGIYKQKKEGGEYIDVFYPLCNFDAWITADISVNDGECITRKIAIAGKLDSGALLPEIEIQADEFEDMRWVLAHWGAKPSIQPERGARGMLRHAIQELSADKMEERSTRNHTGWAVIDGKRVFLHAAGAIGLDGVSVKPPQQMDGYRLPTDYAVDTVVAMRESIALLKVAPMRVSAPLWAAMYAGPLTEIITPAFVASLEGGSGSLKSSYSAVMLNHFGAGFSEERMPADWTGTANSLERLCFHAKDVPLIIDDFKPSTSFGDNAKQLDAVSRIVRSVGNRIGRSRLDGDSNFKRVFTPRGLVMMTAERKAFGKSTNSRILTIDVGPNDIDSALLTAAQKQRQIYGYAMAGFIRWVAANWDDLTRSLPELVLDTRSQHGGNGYHKRLPNATAILYAAFHSAMSYAIGIGAITAEEAAKLKGECYAALQDIMETQSDNTENEDPALKYLTILATLIAQNKAYVGAKGANGVALGIVDGSEKLGWNDGQILYLLPGAYNTVNKYARAEGWAFPSDESTLRKELHRAGYIAERDGDKLTKKVREPGAGRQSTAVNVTAISLRRFAEILSPMLSDDDTAKALAIAIGVPGL